MNQEESLEHALEVLQKKVAEYGDAPDRIGHVLDALFPRGLRIEGSDQWAQMATFMNCVAKINRYAANMPKGHKDSALDLINYAAMLRQRTEDDG